MSSSGKILMYVVGAILRWLVWWTSPIFSWLYEGKHRKLPAPASPLLVKSATELARMIRQKEVKCEALVKCFIAHIKAVNPLVNALIAERYAEAQAEARQVDDILAADTIPEQYSEKNAPFLGVPFTAKEAFATKGLPNTSGLMCRKGHIADRDADAVACMRRAGAIPLGLTNCSELCMWYESSNLIYGRTNNAYHLGRIVGGSSGGEGCILSTAGSVIGIGSDIGGSIRMPAFFNGVFGHKPTTGIVSSAGQFPLAKGKATYFLSTGPMCRYACDLVPMFKVMAGPEGLAKLKMDTKVEVSKLKYYYMVDDGGGSIVSPVHDQIKDCVLKAARHFEGLGASVKPVNIKLLKFSLGIWASKMRSAGNDPFPLLMGNLVSPVNSFYELLLWLTGRRRHTLPAIGLGLVEGIGEPAFVTKRSMEMCDKLREQLQELLGADGVFLYPTHPLPAPYHNQPLTMIANFAYTGIFNVLGSPCTCVPMGLAREGVPVGLQVVGAHHQDHLTLAVAQELESAFGGWVPPF